MREEEREGDGWKTDGEKESEEEGRETDRHVLLVACGVALWCLLVVIKGLTGPQAQRDGGLFTLQPY